MMVLLLSLALAADGDEVGGFFMGQALDTGGLQCHGNVCQKKGAVAGQDGTFSVQHCNGIAKTVTFTVSFVQNTDETRAHFADNVQRVAHPQADALALFEFWQTALNGAGWATESLSTNGGLPVARVANPPHARRLRVSQRDANGHAVYKASLAAAASDTSCAAP